MKIHLTLDDYDARLLEAAIRTACPGHSLPADRRWVLRWLILAGAAAIIREGKMPRPLAVELRKETEEETRQRLENELPQKIEAPPSPPPRRWDPPQPPSQWN